MPYSPTEAEPRWREYWEKEGVYKFDKDAKLPVFSIDTPPPTVSGRIHIGHVFSYTQAEVIARFKRMQGNKLFYPFGFDDNGLPTERLVEKELGIKGSDMPRPEFIEKCLELTAKYRGQFKQLWQSLGVSADWDLEYSTISPLAQRVSQRSFLELLEKGSVVKKNSPALWCTCCKTSVAQAEVDSKEVPSQFHDIQFTVEDGSPLTIATTRPELLPACVAVFVNPDDDRYTNLVGKKVKTPLGDEVEIIADEKVSVDKGTGVVMCCTYGDETDMYWVKKYGLPEKNIVTKDGEVVHQTYGDSGLKVGQARKAMVGKLTEAGTLTNSRQIKHSVGVHERCGTPMEILPVSQWFVQILEIKDRLIEAADKIKWHPEYMKQRYVQWVQNLKWDWCISRQRFFGVPIPVWYSKKTGEMILPDESQLPIDPQTAIPLHLPEGHTADDIEADTDVLDTWATSSLSPQINAHWGEPDSIQDQISPMSLRPQAHDIIRTWAFYTIVKGQLHHGDIPWENIMISGHVQASKGEKISKSKDNAGLTPEALIENYSADAVRYWACGSKLGTDTLFEEKEIQNGKRLMNKLWNAGQFIQMNLTGFNPNENFDENDLESTDRAILIRVQEVAQTMYGHLENFEVGLARGEFEKFFWREFCDDYLEVIKDRIYNPEKNVDGERKKKSAQVALYKAFNAVLKLIAPYLPFVTEEIYQSYFKQFEGEKSIHITRQPHTLVQSSENDAQVVEGMTMMRDVIGAARKFKAENKIRLGDAITSITIRDTRDRLSKILPFVDDVRSVTKAGSVVCDEAETADTIFEK